MNVNIPTSPALKIHANIEMSYACSTFVNVGCNAVMHIYIAAYPDKLYVVSIDDLNSTSKIKLVSRPIRDA